MCFIATGRQERAEHRQTVCRKPKLVAIAGELQSHPEGTKPCDGENAVSGEVSAFADDQMQSPPLWPAEVPMRKELANCPQRFRCVIGSKVGS